MSNKNVNIISTGVYHPTKVIHNDYYIEHFKKLGVDITGLLEFTGRRQKLVCEANETIIDMGYLAAKQALVKANISMDEIDMVIFATDTPEYTAPSNALKVHEKLGGKTDSIVFDINSNCVGMITAMEVASGYMKSNKRINKALIIGSQNVYSFARPDDAITYSCFGDAGAAIILESTIEEETKGYIDSITVTDSTHHTMASMPICGYSKINDDSISKEDKMWWTDPNFNGNFIIDMWSQMVKDVTKRNNISVHNVDHFFFSQFCLTHITETLKKLDVANSSDKYTFVGDEYGYNGVAGPIVALNRALESGVVKKGSTIVLCTVGSGFTTTLLLWKL